MAKSKEYRPAEPLGVEELAGVEVRARSALAGFVPAFPQDARLQVEPKRGWLPAAGEAPGFSIRWFMVTAGLDPNRTTPAFVADLLADLLAAAPGGDPPPYIDFETYFELPGTKDSLERCQSSSIQATIKDDGEYVFTFGAGGVVVEHQHRRAEMARRFAAECDYMAEVIGATIEAGRLPVRMARAGDVFTVKATGGARLGTVFDDEHFGTHFFQCSLLDSSPGDLARRVFDVLAAIPGVTPASHICRFQYGGEPRRGVDPIRAAYDHARALDWPVTSCEFQILFRLESAGSIGGLLPAFLGGRGVRLPMGESKLGSKRAARLLIVAKPDGPQLILQLPPEDEGRLPEVGRALGVSFAE